MNGKPSMTRQKIDDGANARHWLRAIFFLLGTFTLIQQALLLREFLVIAQGNELSSGICLGNWLLGVFLGSIIGSLCTDRLKCIRSTFSASISILVWLAPLQLTLVRLIHWINATPVGTYLSLEKVFIFSALATVPFSFLIGFLFPIAARLSLRGEEKPAGAVTGFYALEAAGSLAGGLVYTFLLAGHFPSLAVCLGAPLLLVPCLWRLCLKWKLRGASLFHAAVFLVMLAALALGPIRRWEQVTTRLRWQSISQSELIESRESRYQNLQLGKQVNQFSLFSNGQLATVFPDLENNRLLAVNLLCQHSHPRRILILGESVSGLAQQLLTSPLESVVTIELDPSVLQLILRHLPPEERLPLSDPRHVLVIADGRQAIQEMSRRRYPETAQAFDILVVQMGEPSTALLNRFYTREFFQAAAHVLSPEGIIALHLLYSENYPSGEMNRFNASLFHTLREVFPYTTLTPGPLPLLFASRSTGSVSDSPQLLSERFEKLGLAPKTWKRIFGTLYPQEKIQWLVSSFMQQHPPENRDNRPVSYYLFTKIFGWYSGSRLAPLLSRLEQVKSYHLLFLLLLPLLVRILRIAATSRRNHPGAPTLFAAWASGFSGLSLEMLIIYWFQIQHGYLYHSIALIIALFMSGLALGAAVMRRILSSSRVRPGLYWPLLLGNAILAALALVIPALPGLGSLPAIFIFFITGISGALTGAIFSAVLHLRLHAENQTGRESGAVNAFDHLGAALGAFLSSSIILPLFGMAMLGFLIAGLASVTMLMLAVDRLFVRQGG